MWGGLAKTPSIHLVLIVALREAQKRAVSSVEVLERSTQLADKCCHCVLSPQHYNSATPVRMALIIKVISRWQKGSTAAADVGTATEWVLLPQRAVERGVRWMQTARLASE